mmetsp:Transcript_28396/g.55846  ORF Transcript_28396/g.55846 Transcript_28396/m.55846 type:complete len:1909 (-) Transcript_28396:155-5881(-)
MMTVRKAVKKVPKRTTSPKKSARPGAASSVNTTRTEDRKEDKALTEPEKVLEAQLWAQLSMAAYRLQDLAKSLQAAKMCTRPLAGCVGKNFEGAASISDGVKCTTNRWRWYSIGESLHGQNLSKLIDPTKQDKRSQDIIRRQAVERFELAMLYAYHCLVTTPHHHSHGPAGALMIQIAKQFWNTIVPFMHDKLTREVVANPVRDILTHLNAAVAVFGNINEMEPSFRVSLYSLQLECYKDKEAWKAGFDLTTETLARLPVSQRKVIWQHRLLFMGKLGMDVSIAVQKMKDGEQRVQANMWSTLANSCTNRLEQYTFRKRAIDCLDNPLDKVEFLIKMGEWLFSESFPISDAEDMLILAVDILNDQEPDVLSAEEDARAAGASALGSAMGSIMGSQKGGGSVMGSQRGGSQLQRTDSRGSDSRSDTHGHPKLSQKNSVAGSVAGSARGSVRGEGGKSVPNKGGGELDISQLCHLVRIYTMLAQMSQTIQQKTENCVVASYYVMRVWETAFQTFQRSKSEEEEAEAQEKPGNEDSSTAFPTSTEEWLVWDVTQAAELRKFFKEDSSNSYSINTNSVGNPALLLHYISLLMQTLDEYGYQLQCFPILALTQLIALDVVESRPLSCLCSLQTARLLDKVGLQDLAVARLDNSGSILPLPEEMAVFHEEVEQREQLKEMLAANSEQGQLTPTNQAKFPVKTVKGVEIRDIWIAIAECSIELGKLNEAKELLQHSVRYCNGFDDQLGYAKCQRLISYIARLEGRPEIALQLEFKVEECKGDASFWRSSIEELLLNLKVAYAKHSTKSQEIKGLSVSVVKEALAVFNAISRDPIKASQHLEAHRTVATLYRLHAQILLDIPDLQMFNCFPVPGAATYKAQGPGHGRRRSIVKLENDFASQCFEPAFELLDKSIKLFEELADVPQVLKLLLMSAKARVEYSKFVFVPRHTPSLLSLTPNAEACEHISIALNLLLRAEELASKLMFTVRPSYLSSNILLPAAIDLATVKMLLVRVFLLMHSQIRPTRKYLALEVPVDLNGPQNSKTSGLDKEQKKILAKMKPKDRDGAMNSVFFTKYDHLFGNSLASNKTVTVAEKALVVASSLLNLTKSATQLPLAHSQVSQCNARVWLERREKFEDEIRTRPKSEEELAAKREAAWAKAQEQKRLEEELAKNNADADGGNLAVPPAGSQPNSARSKKGDTDGKTAEQLAEELRRQTSAQVLDETLAAVDYSYDTSHWSPQVLISLIQRAVFDKLNPTKDEEAVAATPAKAKGKAPAKKGKGAPSPREAVQEVKKVEAPPILDPFAGDSRVNTQLRERAIKHALAAIRDALKHDLPDVVAEASMELANLHGTTSPKDTLAYLALVVSAQVRLYGIRLLTTGSDSHNPEKLVMDMRTTLGAKRSHQTTQKRLVDAFLDVNSMTSKRLKCYFQPKSTYDATESEFQSHLHVDYDTIMSELPAGVAILHLFFDEATSCIYTSLDVGTKEGTDQSIEAHYLSRTPLSPNEVMRFGRLVKAWRTFKATLKNRILVYNSSEIKFLDEMQTDYNNISQALATLLEPCFRTALISAELLADRQLVLISDRLMFELPLESLPYFKYTTSVSRDFSLHLLYSRLISDKVAAETAKKGGSVGFIADPFLEDGSGRTLAAFQEIQKFGGGDWDGVSGRDSVPVLGQWQRLLVNSKTFIYHGFERYCACLPVSNLCALNCEGTRTLILADKACNEVSHRRQSKTDNTKRSIEIELEDTYNSILLLSSRGADAIVTNQYAIAPDCNNAAIQALCGAFLSDKQTIGSSVTEWRLSSTYTPPKIEEDMSRGTSRQSAKPAATAKKEKASARTEKKSAREDKSARTSARRRQFGEDPSFAAEPQVLPEVKFEIESADGNKDSKIIRRYDKLNLMVVGLPHIQQIAGGAGDKKK